MLYSYDLSVDSGLQSISATGLDGIDTLAVEGFAAGTAVRFNPFVSGGADYLDIIFEDAFSSELLRLRISAPDFETGEGFEILVLGDDTIYLDDLYQWISANSIDDSLGFGASSVVNAVYPPNSASSVSGVQAQVNGGTVEAMTLPPNNGGIWGSTSVGKETLHPFVMTAYSQESTEDGYRVSMTLETYLKEFDFLSGISPDDVRLTLAGIKGEMSLEIHIDSLNYSFTVDYFETGKTIYGVGDIVYSMLNYFNGSWNIEQVSGAIFSGVYEGTVSMPASPWLSTVTYFFEKLSFSNGTDIDLQNDQLTFTGTAGNDTLYGLNERGDVIIGGGGTDWIYAYGGDDTIIGGTGYDHMHGGEGDDVYYFEIGDSVNEDRVVEMAGEGDDMVLFGTGIDPEDVYAWTYSGSLYVQYSANDKVLIGGGFDVSGATDIGSYLEKIVFADNTEWDLTNGLYLRASEAGQELRGSVYGDTIIGSGGTDWIYGYAGNDTIIGGTGYDHMYGGDGDDVYVFNLGDSLNQDRVVENLSEGFDTIIFGAGIDPGDIYAWTDAGSLYLKYSANDTLFIAGGYGGATNIGDYLEKIVFADNTEWDLTQGLLLRASAAGQGLAGSDQDDRIYGSSGTDWIYGHGGDDIIFGGGGSDYLTGGAGADIFGFMADDVGNGADHILDFSLLDGDAIDLRDVLSGYDPLLDDIADFISFNDGGYGAELSVDIDGAGTTYGWVQIATIYGQSGIDVQDWVDNGQLIVT